MHILLIVCWNYLPLLCKGGGEGGEAIRDACGLGFNLFSELQNNVRV